MMSRYSPDVAIVDFRATQIDCQGDASPLAVPISKLVLLRVVPSEALLARGGQRVVADRGCERAACGDDRDEGLGRQVNGAGDLPGTIEIGGFTVGPAGAADRRGVKRGDGGSRLDHRGAGNLGHRMEYRVVRVVDVAHLRLVQGGCQFGGGGRELRKGERLAGGGQVPRGIARRLRALHGRVELRVDEAARRVHGGRGLGRGAHGRVGRVHELLRDAVERRPRRHGRAARVHREGVGRRGRRVEAVEHRRNRVGGRAGGGARAL
mmetsp:Transcript_25210/g.48920  ORF Transcript_25210/g.48920 Transcript_25210/m.48920 type:complete len:265 (+) Transcript_25210:516-1310(+)